MDDPFGLMPVGFDVTAAMMEIGRSINPPLTLPEPEPAIPYDDVPARPVVCYDWRSHLESHLRKGVRQQIIDEPECMTIRFCFVDLMRLFRENYIRKNFLSYGFFINRILEMHGHYGRLFGKEPSTKHAVCQNWKLWHMYEDWLEVEINSSGSESSKIIWHKYKQWQTST